MKNGEIMIRKILLNLLVTMQLLSLAQLIQGAQKFTKPLNQINEKGLVVLFDCGKNPKKQFLFNNWKGKLKCEVTPQITPVGSAAWRFTISDIKTPGAIHMNLAFPQNGEWRKSKFNAISFWFKGDGSKKRIRLALTNGKTIQWHLILNNEKWEKITIPLLQAQHGFNPSMIKSLSLKINSKCEFAIGDIVMEVGTRNIPLTRCRQTTAVLVEKISGGLWSDDKKAGSFYRISTKNEVPEMNTDVLLSHDRKNLYVVSKLFYDDISKAKGRMTKRDDQVYQEDDFEIFIDSNNNTKSFFQFAFGLAGGIFDQKRYYDKDLCLYTTSVRWNADLKSKITKTAKSINFKISIPFKDIEINPDKAPYVGLQLARTNLNSKKSAYSSWSPTTKFPYASNYGIMVLGRKNPSQFKFSDTKLSEIEIGKYVLSGNIENFGDEKEVSLKFTFSTVPDVKNEFSKKINLKHGNNDFRELVTLPSMIEGSYRLALLIDENPDITPTVDVFSFKVVVPLDIEFGEITFSPQPKKVEWLKGVFPISKKTTIIISEKASKRTRKTAEYFQNELLAHTGVKLRLGVYSKSLSLKNSILFATDESIPKTFSKLKGELSDMKNESYLIDIKPDHGVMVGKDEAGLYYSVVTLCQLLRAPQVRMGKSAIPALFIKDWPDLAYRLNLYYTELLVRSNDVAKRMRANPKEKMKFFKRYIKRFVAGNKFNILIMSINSIFKWEKHPELRYNAFLDKNDIMEISNYCREHFINFIPHMNIAGHDPYFFHRAHPELRETGYKSMADLSNPEYQRIMKDCLGEIVDACNPQYVDIGHDEFWHRTSGEKITKKAKPRNEIFYDDIMMHYNLLKNRGVGMLMYGDMLLRDHHGDRYDCYKMAKKLPKDIIINNWSAKGVPKSSSDLKTLGFKTIFNILNGFGTTPYDSGNIKGYGNIAYAPLIHTTQSYTRDEHAVAYCFHGLCRAADYAWNFDVDNQAPLGTWRREKLLNLLPVYSFQSNPHTSSNFVPISLDASANETLQDKTAADGSGWFDLGAKQACMGISDKTDRIGLIPVKINTNSSGKNIIILRKKAPQVEIPVNAKFSSIILLHTCFYPKSDAKEKNKFRRRGKNHVKGTPVCKYILEYKNGTTSEIDACYGSNILEWMPYSPARFLPDCRYVWEMKLPSGEMGCLYQYDWINPFPNRAIRKIIVKKAETEADVAIVAITGRKSPKEDNPNEE